MKSLFTSRYVLLTMFTTVSVFALIAIYFGWITPQKQQLDQLNVELKVDKKLLASITAKQMEQSSSLSENTKKIQIQLPVKPLEDQFLLDLQKTELKSGSEIQSIGITDGKLQMTDEQKLKQATTFNYGSTDSSTNGNNNNANQAVQKQTAINAQQSTTNSTAQKNTSDNNAKTVPNNVKSMTYNLNVKSSNYDHFMQFLQGLEQLERFTSVDSLSFSGQTKAQNGQTNQQLSYNLVVSTYYVPGLADLSKDVPVVEYPKPQNKENPLYSGGSSNGEKATP